MANTPILALPYPVPADSVDVPRDIQALAVSLDTKLGGGGAGGGGPLQSAPVLDVGMAGQIRAGRQLAVADFTALGLATPVGLFNLSGLTNLGSGGALVNKGTVPFGPGINGTAATAAVFAGSTGQALYIADTGAADPFRIKTGSWGCWFRTAKRGTQQQMLCKLTTAATQVTFSASVSTTNAVAVAISVDGTTLVVASGVSDVADDRWHFLVGAYDGTVIRVYVDGVLEAALSPLVPGPMFGTSTAPLNIGGVGADGATAAVNPFYGRVDEAFVAADVLSEDQIRALYCAKIAHGYATTPTRISLNVRRRKRGGPLAVADFPTQPLRLYNFVNGAVTDQGSNGQTITSGGAIADVAGPDGATTNARTYTGAGDGATDAGLPAGTATRSFGAWFKTTNTTGTAAIVMSWGTASADTKFYVVSGSLWAANGTDNAGPGGFVADGQWHFVVVVEDNAAGDGVRRKCYLDGRLVIGSTVLVSITLAGANRFRVGSNPDNTASFTGGQVSRAFVCGYALTFEQVAALYAKGSMALAPSPKNTGDHVEAMDATNVLAVFDTLDSTAQVDLGVAS